MIESEYLSLGMSRIWVYSLLISFAFLALPKTLYHTHDHFHPVSKHVKVSFDDAGCFVCDFDYTSLSGPLALPLILKIKHSSLKIAEAKSWNSDNSVEHVASRGPPVS